MSIQLDIACGAQKHAGFTGIDIAAAPGVDIVHDLFTFPWPVASDSVGHAVCSHFVEHLPHREALDFDCLALASAPNRWLHSKRNWGFVRDLWFDFWEEVHRVLEPGGTIQVACPFYSSRRADQDPTHERRICEQSFSYLSQAWLERMRCVSPYAADFEVEGLSLVRYAGVLENADCDRQINVVDDIHILLRAKKPAKCWWKEKT